MTGTSLETYLFFCGKCEAALDFYKTAIGAKIGTVMRFNESPEPLRALAGRHAARSPGR